MGGKWHNSYFLPSSEISRELRSIIGLKKPGLGAISCTAQKHE
jgi:hypothetical protein